MKPTDCSIRSVKTFTLYIFNTVLPAEIFIKLKTELTASYQTTRANVWTFFIFLNHFHSNATSRIIQDIKNNERHKLI